MSEESEKDWLLESVKKQPHLIHLIEGTPQPRRVGTLSVDPKRTVLNPPSAVELDWESLFPYGYNPPLPILYVD